MGIKTFRFEGTVICDMVLWINAATQEDAEALLSSAPSSHLKNATSISHIIPKKETINITSIRESTGDNP